MYDAVVIGGGPAGYVCGITLAKLGANVCVIERMGLGGTCTHKGCIPTKYFHSMADIIKKAKSAKKFGINSTIEVDYKTLKSKMRATVSKLASGISLLFKESGVELIEGEATIKSPNQVQANGKILETKNIVLATGSHPVCISGYEFSDRMLSTDTIFDLDELPKSILIVGGGYSGCEFASILNVFDCKIWLVEMEDNLLPNQPKEVGVAIEKFMKLDGIDVFTKSKIEKIDSDAVFVNGKEFKPEKILICAGRRPNLNTDELKESRVSFEQKGVNVNNKMQTNVANIYAIGDVTGNYELAHVASRQGEIAAQNIMGKNSTIDYSAIPYCVFTFPEIAIVGKCEGKSSESPFIANAKANCLGDTRGFVKVFEKDGVLHGVIIVGPHASELIGEATLAVQMKLKTSDLIETIHAHPTLPEAFADALRSLEGKF